MDVLWIIQSSFSHFQQSTRKLLNIFDDFLVLSILFTNNARKSVEILKYGQKFLVKSKGDLKKISRENYPFISSQADLAESKQRVNFLVS